MSKFDCATRPWGKYEVLLDGDDCKVKMISVNPKQKPSYQYHHKRNEHWIIISGTGQVKENDEIMSASPGEAFYIPAMSKHTIMNTSEEDQLIFIEVQTGDYFGEDDIVRLEDDYGRV